MCSVVHEFLKCTYQNYCCARRASRQNHGHAANFGILVIIIIHKRKYPRIDLTCKHIFDKSACELIMSCAKCNAKHKHSYHNLISNILTVASSPADASKMRLSTGGRKLIRRTVRPCASLVHILVTAAAHTHSLSQLTTGVSCMSAVYIKNRISPDSKPTASKCVSSVTTCASIAVHDAVNVACATRAHTPLPLSIRHRIT
jgi:hypothetical protein